MQFSETRAAHQIILQTSESPCSSLIPPPRELLGCGVRQTSAGSIARPSTPHTRGPLRTKKETRFAGRLLQFRICPRGSSSGQVKSLRRAPGILLGVLGSFRGQDSQTLFTGFGGNQQDPVFPTGSTHHVAVVHSPTAGGNYAKPVD